MASIAFTDTFLFDMNGPLTAVGAASPVRAPFRHSSLTGPLSAVATLARTEPVADMNGPVLYNGPVAPAPRATTPRLLDTPLTAEQRAGLATVGAALRGRTWTEVTALAAVLSARASAS